MFHTNRSRMKYRSDVWWKFTPHLNSASWSEYVLKHVLTFQRENRVWQTCEKQFQVGTNTTVPIIDTSAKNLVHARRRNGKKTHRDLLSGLRQFCFALNFHLTEHRVTRGGFSAFRNGTIREIIQRTFDFVACIHDNSFACLPCWKQINYVHCTKKYRWTFARGKPVAPIEDAIGERIPCHFLPRSSARQPMKGWSVIGRRFTLKRNPIIKH